MSEGSPNRLKRSVGILTSDWLQICRLFSKLGILKIMTTVDCKVFHVAETHQFANLISPVVCRLMLNVLGYAKNAPFQSPISDLSCPSSAHWHT